MKRSQIVRNRRGAAAQSKLQTPGLANAALQSSDTFQFPTAGLLMIEAAVYLRYHLPTCPAKCRCAEKAIKFLRSHGVALRRRGRTFLVRREAIDRVLDGQPSDLESVAHAIAQSDRSRHKAQHLALV